jgi:hypothetical protein
MGLPLMHRYLIAIAFLGISAADAADQMETSFGGPDWPKFSHIYDGARFVIGGYPINAEFGVDTTGIAQAVVGATQIPASVTAPNHSAGVAGYARTSSKAHMAVGVHGFGGILADGGQAEGAHFLTSNCGAQACAPNSGYNAADNFVIEADINLMKTTAGAPSGNAFGLIFFGASEAVPTGTFQAIRVDSPGVFQNPVLAWKEALYTSDGAAKTGIDLGTTDVGLPGTSQPIRLRSRSTDGADHQSMIEASQEGDIKLLPSSGRLDIDGPAIRIAGTAPPASSHTPCDTGEIRWGKDYVYVCVEQNLWRRSQLQDW